MVTTAKPTEPNLPFQGHYTGQPAFAGASSSELGDFVDREVFFRKTGST